MNKSIFSDVNLGMAKVGERLDINHSTINGFLNLNGMDVKRSFSLSESNFLSDVNLVGAKVGQQLNMDGSKFHGQLEMEHIHIGLDLLARNILVLFPGKGINLGFAEILENLDIAGSKLPSLSLAGGKIYGEFCLFQDNKSVKWSSGANLILRNADIGTMQDSPESWPEILDLNGFSYSHLGGLGSTGKSPVNDRGFSWYCKWLEKQRDYSPQPYNQLARVLFNMGHRKEADEILYAGKERERKISRGMMRIWMTFQNETIGYGYKMSRSLLLAILVVLLGVNVLIVDEIVSSQNSVIKGFSEKFAYSLDMLLPVVQLSKAHFDIKLHGLVKDYFYFHRFAGVILGFFLIAGISGLTKR